VFHYESLYFVLRSKGPALKQSKWIICRRTEETLFIVTGT